MYVADLQRTAVIDEFVAASLMFLEHHARFGARAHAVAPHDGAGSIGYVYEMELLLGHIARRRERRALNEVGYDIGRIG